MYRNIPFMMVEEILKIVMYFHDCVFHFRNDPPGQSVSVATQELLRLVESNPTGLPALDPIKDLHMRDMELVDRFTILRQIEDSLQTFQCVNEPNFLENVSIVFILIGTPKS